MPSHDAIRQPVRTVTIGVATRQRSGSAVDARFAGFSSRIREISDDERGRDVRQAPRLLTWRFERHSLESIS